MEILLVIQIILSAYLKGSGFLSHHIEALVHILRGKRTSFYVITCETRVNPVLEHLLHAHFSTMFCHICFISNNYNRHLALFHFIIPLRVHEIVPPGGDALIALDVREVEDNHTAISSSVKSVAQTLEALLASGVPDLERYLLPRIECHNFFHKVSADRWTLDLVDLFVLKVLDQSGLANVRVSDDHHFQESGLSMA